MSKYNRKETNKMKVKEINKTAVAESPAGGNVWWTAEQAAEYLKVTPFTICRWRATKNFPAHRISTRTVLYCREEIDLWIKKTS